jgi:hypothetical protein
MVHVRYNPFQRLVRYSQQKATLGSILNSASFASDSLVPTGSAVLASVSQLTTSVRITTNIIVERPHPSLPELSLVSAEVRRRGSQRCACTCLPVDVTVLTL